MNDPTPRIFLLPRVYWSFDLSIVRLFPCISTIYLSDHNSPDPDECGWKTCTHELSSCLSKPLISVFFSFKASLCVQVHRDSVNSMVLTCRDHVRDDTSSSAKSSTEAVWASCRYRTVLIVGITRQLKSRSSQWPVCVRSRSSLLSPTSARCANMPSKQIFRHNHASWLRRSSCSFHILFF